MEVLAGAGARHALTEPVPELLAFPHAGGEVHLAREVRKKTNTAAGTERKEMASPKKVSF